MRKYSVLLLLPDYLAETFGHETYFTHVIAGNVKNAVAAAQQEAAGDNAHVNDPEDFYPLLCVEGHHPDLLIP